MTVKERIKEYIKFKDISVREFESKTGLSNGYVRNLKECPSGTRLENILEAYPDLNRVWLMTGEGDMLIGEKGTIRTAGRDYVERGKIEHKGGEEQAVIIAELRAQVEQLKSQLNDKERIIALYEKMLNPEEKN